MDHELKERAIPWSNCLSFAADNASVMTGVHKGVLAFVKKENENIYFIGCPCHLIHLAAEKGANVLPLSIEDQLIQVYYYLDKSSKRQKVLQNLQKLNDVEVRKILKHVSTRWLSLGICLNRMLSQWVPLTEFFKEESKTTTGSKSVSQKPSKPVKDKPSKPVKDKPSKSVKDKPSKPNSVKDKPSKPDSVKDKPSKPVEKLVSPTASKSSAKKVSSKKVDNQTASSSKGGLDFLFSKETDSNQSKKQPDKGETTSRNPHKSDSKKQTDSMDNTSQKSEPNFAAKKAKSIYENFKSRNFKLYCLFLKAVIPVFDNANQLLQNEKPCIHILHSVLQGLLQSILTRFVKPTVLIGSPESVNFKDRDNQKEDSNLFIGVEARAFIQDNPNLDTDAFFKAVRAYFCAVCTYMCKNFPFGDEVLVNARVADITQRKDIEFNAVNFFVQRFPVLAGIVGESLNDLEEEFLQFQVHELSQDILDSDRMDLAWYKIGKLIHPMTGNARFPLLTKVMLGILTIFHSNTDCERIFSFVTKTKTKFRPNMKTGTLGALVTHKVCMNSRGESAFKSNPSTSLLKKAKKATYEALSK
ncbi:uncharacterized protein [Argopecten irradians]|uniref:uncharacterized protein n=1 Tax=Argopecten irradians TaxID=31199 RepID=UPI00371AC307